MRKSEVEGWRRRSALQQTADALYQCAIKEIRRLRKMKIKAMRSDSPETRAHLVRVRRLQGVAVKDIAAETGISQNRVYEILRRCR